MHCPQSRRAEQASALFVVTRLRQQGSARVLRYTVLSGCLARVACLVLFLSGVSVARPLPTQMAANASARDESSHAEPTRDKKRRVEPPEPQTVNPGGVHPSVSAGPWGSAPGVRGCLSVAQEPCSPYACHTQPSHRRSWGIPI